MGRRYVLVLLLLACAFIGACASSGGQPPAREGNPGQPVLVSDPSMQGYVTVQHVQKSDGSSGSTIYSFLVSYQATGTMVVNSNSWQAFIEAQQLTPTTPPSSLSPLEATTLPAKSTTQGWIAFAGPATLNIVNLNLLGQAGTVLVTWPINRYD